MANAIGQLLMAQLHTMVLSEFPHPKLKTKGAGRKPAIDFITLESGSSIADGKIEYAIESKWSSRVAPNLDDILWDLVRLDLLSRHIGCTCIFLLSGRRNFLEPFLKSDNFKYSYKGHERTILPLEPGGGQIRLRLNALPAPTLRKLKARLASYTDENLPDYLITSLPHVASASEISMGFPVYVWAMVPKPSLLAPK